MTKFGFFVFVVLILTAMAFFIRLALDLQHEGQGTPAKQEEKLVQITTEVTT